MIRIHDLSVHYGGRRALDCVSLAVEEGELFGVLGPNGAGKTTLFKVLSGQMRPTTGSASVDGKDTTSRARAVQHVLGIVPQTFAGYEILTAYENLEFFGSLYGVKGAILMRRARDLLKTVSLDRRAHDAVSGFSGGMKHRLNIVLGLIHDPKVVIMDEPTTGLDPIAREELWEIIHALRKRGVTILLTTHYMQEAESLCDRVAILDQGRVKLTGRPRELGKTLDQAFHDCVTADSVAAEGPDPDAIVGRVRRHEEKEAGP
ncbi:MAG: ABC transporter ATP-binding protein [Euryarchaeota archaeon]|nr:ABC transporter ATP-binding protein [Euryarchaeota archaeon]